MFSFWESKLRSILNVENFNYVSRNCLYFILAMNVVASSMVTIFIPGFASAAADLHTTQGALQFTIVVHLIGEIIGRLLWGPLSDYIGQKRGLIPAVTLSIIGQIGCCIAPSIELLIVSRFIQAIGSGVVYVVSLNYIAYHFDGVAKNKAYSMLEMYQPIANLTAPFIGSLLCMLGGWRFIFIFLLLAQLTIRTMLKIYMQEDEPSDVKPSVSLIMNGYLSVIKNKRFVIYAVIPGFAVGCYLIFSAHVPEIYGCISVGNNSQLDALYIALIQSTTLVFNLFSTVLYRSAVQKYGLKTSRRIGGTLNSLFLFILVLLFSRVLPFNYWTIITAMVIQNASSAFLVPVSVTGAMESATEKTGILAASIVIFRNLIMSLCLTISSMNAGIDSLVYELFIPAACVIVLLYFRRTIA